MDPNHPFNDLVNGPFHSMVHSAPIGIAGSAHNHWLPYTVPIPYHDEGSVCRFARFTCLGGADLVSSTVLELAHKRTSKINMDLSCCSGCPEADQHVIRYMHTMHC